MKSGENRYFLITLSVKKEQWKWMVFPDIESI